MYLNTNVAGIHEHWETKRASLDDESACEISVMSDPIFHLTAMTNIYLEGVNRPAIRMTRLSARTETDMNPLHDFSNEAQAAPDTTSIAPLSLPSIFCVPLFASTGKVIKILDAKVRLSSGLVRKSSSLRSVCETNEEEEVSLKPPQRGNQQSMSVPSESIRS